MFRVQCVPYFATHESIQNISSLTASHLPAPFSNLSHHLLTEIPENRLYVNQSGEIVLRTKTLGEVAGEHLLGPLVEVVISTASKALSGFSSIFGQIAHTLDRLDKSLSFPCAKAFSFSRTWQDNVDGGDSDPKVISEKIITKKDELAKKEKELDETKKQWDEQKLRMSNLQKDLVKLDEEIQIIEKRIIEEGARVSKLNKKVYYNPVASQVDIAEMMKANSEISEKIKDDRNDLLTKRAEKKDCETKISRTEGRVMRHRKTHVDLSSSINNLRDEIDTLQRKQDRKQKKTEL